LLDHVRCDFRFRAPWKLTADKPHRFTFRECNYELDSVSTLNVALDGSSQLTLRDVIAPDEALLARPADQRKPGDGERLRKVSATVLAVPTFLPGLAHTALPPDPEPARDAAPRRLRGVVAQSKPVSTFPVGWVKSTPPADDQAAEDDHPGHSLLHLLLDTRKGLALLLLLAAGFGAAHALTPGHGKTLVAAYLVGQRGTIGHAFVLGLVTTLTHTGGVILLALILALLVRDVNRAAVESALGLVGGLLIAGLGLWLLMQRATGRADHIHLDGGHHHHHESEPMPELEGARAGWVPIILLGI
jgi:hypothetical protein